MNVYIVRLQVSDGNGAILSHVASITQSQMETNPTNHVDNHTKIILNEDEPPTQESQFKEISNQSRS